MTQVSVYEAKTHLSRLLRRVRHGEEIVISVSGRPVARLVPVAAADGPRVLGGDEGLVWEAKDFNAPLPPEILDAFYAGATEARSGERRARQQIRRRR